MKNLIKISLISLALLTPCAPSTHAGGLFSAPAKDSFMDSLITGLCWFVRCITFQPQLSDKSEGQNERTPLVRNNNEDIPHVLVNFDQQLSEQERLAREEAERKRKERLEAERHEHERLAGEETERKEQGRHAELKRLTEERLARQEIERHEQEHRAGEETERKEKERLTEVKRLEEECLAQQEAERQEQERLAEIKRQEEECLAQEAERQEQEHLAALKRQEEERLAEEEPIAQLTENFSNNEDLDFFDDADVQNNSLSNSEDLDYFDDAEALSSSVTSGYNSLIASPSSNKSSRYQSRNSSRSQSRIQSNNSSRQASNPVSEEKLRKNKSNVIDASALQQALQSSVQFTERIENEQKQPNEEKENKIKRIVNSTDKEFDEM